MRRAVVTTDCPHRELSCPHDDPALMTLAESPQSCSAEFPTLLGIRLRDLRLVVLFFFGPVFGVCDTALTTVGELAARAAWVSGRLLLLCQ